MDGPRLRGVRARRLQARNPRRGASTRARPDERRFRARGAGTGNLAARSTYTADGQATRVNEETQKVAPGGATVTEFHIGKPDGWPRGDYQVVILVNGEVAATRKFSVK